MKVLVVICLALAAILLLTCEPSNTSPDADVLVSDSTKLLGLQTDHTSWYVRYDSIAVYFPDYRVRIDTTTFDLTAAAIDSAREQFDLFRDGTRSYSLQRADVELVNLGYYRSIGESDSLFYFPEPSTIFPAEVTSIQVWEAFTPTIAGEDAQLTTSFLFLNWGFDIERKFDRTETILLPIGTFSCLVFKTEFRLPGNDDIFKAEYEYYAWEVGLVKLHSIGLFGSSQTFMVSRTDSDT